MAADLAAATALAWAAVVLDRQGCCWHAAFGARDGDLPLRAAHDVVAAVVEAEMVVMEAEVVASGVASDFLPVGRSC